MKVGIIGLGKMGFNLAINLKRNGHDVISYDVNTEALDLISREGILTANSLYELVDDFKEVKIIWLMLPSGDVTENTLQELKRLLTNGDIVIEGGNSNYKDSVRRSVELQQQGIHFLDCGTSGGTEGALNGICAMIGGSKSAFEFCESIFKDISLPNGYLHCGESGAGHYVKMIHNGIEYGMMQSIAEGFEML
ncbi:MAG: NADP-dependent phosphogluconate dehydrogenase, partial [Pyrinomonadaceae bacterium]|nr:NADP-dependent phosphogluconate dehydrogenase [Sphingobacteriaceae bacterium]